jgi:hypothetical protein
MAEPREQYWEGASGKNYLFYVYDCHSRIDSGQLGIYIYCKLNERSAWVPLYIGQGDLSVRCTESRRHASCIESKGATHVHMRLAAGEADRLGVERDLLARFTNVYAPSGCNMRDDGSRGR